MCPLMLDFSEQGQAVFGEVEDGLLRLAQAEDLLSQSLELLLPRQMAGIAVGLGDGMWRILPKLELTMHLLWGLLSISVALPLGGAWEEPTRWSAAGLVAEVGAQLWGR